MLTANRSPSNGRSDSNAVSRVVTGRQGECQPAAGGVGEAEDASMVAGSVAERQPERPRAEGDAFQIRDGDAEGALLLGQRQQVVIGRGGEGRSLPLISSRRHHQTAR